MNYSAGGWNSAAFVSYGTFSISARSTNLPGTIHEIQIDIYNNYIIIIYNFLRYRIVSWRCGRIDNIGANFHRIGWC